MVQLGVLAQRFRSFGFLLAFLAAFAAPATMATRAMGQSPGDTPKTLDEMKSLQQKTEALVPKLLPAVVGVQIGNARGSGVIVSEDGLVLTAGHVVGKPGQSVQFFFADGKTGKGTTLGFYEDADAGLMKITDAGKWPFVAKAPSGKNAVGNWCLAIGHPLGYQEGRPPVVRVGRVLHVQDDMIQTDCALVGGDSGGPLFDLEGRVIGINSRIGQPMDMNLHVLIDIFNQNWDRLVKGEQWKDSVLGREGGAMTAILSPLASSVQDSLVRIMCDGQEAVLGTVVGPDGWVLTKASELKGKVACKLRDGRELDAKTVGLLETFDLAMLKIEASGLTATTLTQTQPVVGQWLAAPRFGDDPVRVGVLSVPQRRIPFVNGIIGIALKTDPPQGPAEVERVFPETPADKAGVKPRDVITHLDGKSVATAAELIAGVRQKRPGAIIRLNVQRGEKTLAVPIKLGSPDGSSSQKREDLNRSSTGISQRHDDFPVVLQNDIVLRPIDCGGPLMDLDGKVIGINIARAGRTETYSVPAQIIQERLVDLMSGELNPEKLAAEKAAADKAAADKAAADKAAADKAAADKAAADKAAADKAAADKAAADKAAAEAAQKAAADKAAADKAAAEKAAAEKAAAEKAAAEKAAAEKAAAEKAAQENKPPENPSPTPPAPALAPVPASQG